MASRGYARGHLAPFAVMGGDRDDDDEYAEYDADNSSHEGDDYDANTIYQANYMSNIAPQHHKGFNGWDDTSQGRVFGLWFELERWIQDELVEEQLQEAWIFAGCIFGSGDHEQVGPDNNIWVPSLFYKIVIMEDPESDTPVVLAYLLPHQRKRHGDLDSFLVSIDVIEALAGVDFFSQLELSEDEIDLFESEDTWNTVSEHFDTE
jgi:endonuclease G